MGECICGYPNGVHAADCPFVDVTVRVPDLDDAPLLMQTMGKALCEGMGDPKEARQHGSPYWWAQTSEWHLRKCLGHIHKVAALKGSTHEHHLRNAVIRALMALHMAQKEEGNA